MNKSDTKPAAQSDARGRLQERYDSLWSAAVGHLRAGNMERDSVLAAGLPDRRRGLTLIAQPSPEIRKRVGEFLNELRGLEPDQLYYAASELHVTVLSLFTATVEHERFLARTEQYVSAVDAAMRGVKPMQIEFTGVTAAPAAIMIQGFCENEALEEIREALRRQLRSHHLADGVDERYRLETAHMTVVRFRAPLRSGASFAAALEQARQRPFGHDQINCFRLVKNDWYMSSQIVQTIKAYPLPFGGNGH